MKKVVNKDRLNVCVDYIKSVYSFEEVLRKYNLLTEDLVREGKVSRTADSIIIPCFLHVDYSPSLSCSTKLNVFNCFSCGTGGDIIKFMSLCETKLMNNKKNYFEMIEHLLRTDTSLRLHAKCDTIFTCNKVDLEQINSLKLKSSLSFRESFRKPSNFLELSRIISREFKSDNKTIILAISLMEKGFSASETYDILKGKNKKPNNTFNAEGIDFSALLNFEEGGN